MDRKMRETVVSLEALNPERTFYRIEYTGEYLLDDLLEKDLKNVEELTLWAAVNLLGRPSGGEMRPGGGCSAFVCRSPEGHILYGRNYDYMQSARNVLVHTKPEGDKESVSIAAGGWVCPHNEELETSPLVAGLPYLLMDGMNENGLAVSVLKLRGKGTAQQKEGKHTILTTVALRLILDRAGSVDEAISLLNQYNMQSSMEDANFHFFLADAAGVYALVEYGPGNGVMAVERHSMEEAETEWRQVTNFYRLIPCVDDGTHGLDRYQILDKTLRERNETLTMEEAMELLSEVYQDLGETETHETQWSVVYDLTEKKGMVCPRVNATDPKAAFYSLRYAFDWKGRIAE